MTTLKLSQRAQRWATLKVAVATLLTAALMNAGIGHFGLEVERARAEQLQIANVRLRAAAATSWLDRLRLGDTNGDSDEGRNGLERAVRKLEVYEDRSTIPEFLGVADLYLASLDKGLEAVRGGDLKRAKKNADALYAAHEGLETELAALDRRCRFRAQGGIAAMVIATFATLLLSAALVSYFAARHRRRTASLAELELHSRSSEARERRFRLLLDIEEATRDLTAPDRVIASLMRLLSGYLDGVPCVYATVDHGGGVVSAEASDPEAPPCRRPGPQEFAFLRQGRTKVEASVVHCPQMRDGELRAIVSVQGGPGRAWTPEEVAIVEDVAARCGVFLERADSERAKLQSRWTSALLDAQVNSSLDGILIVDPQGKKVLQNHRFAEVWGVPAEVIDDEDDARQVRLVAERVKDPVAFAEVVAKLYATPDRAQRDEIELIDGTVLDRHTAPAVGTDGTIYGRIWTFRDITERIRAERALREAQEDLEARVEARTREFAAARVEAERANAAKSEFLSRMSHELRTPLNAILGFGQILDRHDLDALQKESVHYILKGGRHLLGLINEVLDISRVETGNSELSIEPVPLGEVLTESSAMVRTMAADRDVRLEGDFEAIEALHVVADRQRLKQVLINLLSNAVKYNRPGGRVTVRCDVQEDRVRIAVEDTGRGMSPEGLAKLFVPFERLDAAATSVEGTGLGLFLTQRLVVAMGGRLNVESVLGEGSVFSLDLELGRAPCEGLVLVEGGAAEPVAEGDRTYSILSIEDNSANTRLFEVLLATRPDVRLTVANEGMEGFSIARREAPDLILLDINLPDVSGIEVLTRLKRSGTTSGIPVIVVSADASDANAQASLAAGAAEFLTKPLNVDDFLRAVDARLGAAPLPEARAA